MIQQIRRGKSRRIADDLRMKFSSERIYHGMPVPSATELAEDYGVSVPTAHNALNLLVEDGLLYRVQGSGTFINRERVEKCLQIGIADQTVSVEYLTPEINRVLNYHFDCAAGYFRKCGCEVKMITYAELMGGHALDGLDGLLVSASYLDGNAVALLRKSGLPVVVYRYDYSENFMFSSLIYDGRPGIREALDYLRLNEKDRLILVCEDTPSCCGKRRCLLEMLDERGFDHSRISEHRVTVPEREISCYRLVRSRTRDFRNAVVFCTNDEIAVNLVNALTLENLVCGTDYRLVGMGNRGGYGENAAGRLQIASVDLPIRLMSEEAARQLLYRIEHPSECISQVMVPTSFILRKSAGRKMNLETSDSGTKERNA